jgi:hypothetical protein
MTTSRLQKTRVFVSAICQPSGTVTTLHRPFSIVTYRVLVAFIGSLLAFTGCMRDPDLQSAIERVAPEGTEVTVNARGQVQSLHLSGFRRESHQAFIRRLRRAPKSITSLTVEDSDIDDAVIDALGELSDLERLSVDLTRGSETLVTLISDEKYKRNELELTCVVAPNHTLDRLSLPASLSALDIVTNDYGVTQLNVDSLSGINVRRLSIQVPGNIVTQDLSRFESLPGLESLVVHGNCEPEFIVKMLGEAAIKELWWFRKEMSFDFGSGAIPQVTELGKLGDWSNLESLHISLSPGDSERTKFWRTSSTCQEQRMLYANDEFINNLRLATKVKHVDLSFVVLPDDGWQTLAELSSLISLRAHCCAFDRATARHFIRTGHPMSLTVAEPALPEPIQSDLRGAIEYFEYVPLR